MAATQESVAYFCPQCGGAALDFSELAGGNAKCRVCTWEGAAHERVAYPFKHDFISDESMLRDMLNDIRLIFGASSKLYGELLSKWGFIRPGPKVVRDLTRYMAACGRAVLTALIEEREKLEKEEHGETN